MQITNQPDSFQSGLDGAGPTIWYGKSALNGTRDPWRSVAVGSIYYEKPNTTRAKKWRKVCDNKRTDDWCADSGVHVIRVRITRAMMTDGGSTTGTYDLTEKIPAGAVFLRTTVSDIVGFTGNTSATIQVGDGTTVARYNTGTPSVFTTAAQGVDMGVPSGTVWHTAEVTPRVTITGGTDFTAITAGELTLTLYYLG